MGRGSAFRAALHWLVSDWGEGLSTPVQVWEEHLASSILCHPWTRSYDSPGSSEGPLSPARWSSQNQFSRLEMGPPRSSCPSSITIASVSQVPASPPQAWYKCFTSIILASPTPAEGGYRHPRFVGEETKAQRSDLPMVTQLVSSRDWASPPHHAAFLFVHLECQGAHPLTRQPAPLADSFDAERFSLSMN